MNGYARLSDVRAALGILGAKEPLGSGFDGRLLALIDEVSREFDRETAGHHLYALTGTRYFEAKVRHAWGRQRLPVGPLVSITSVAWDEDEDGTYGTALADGTDFFSEKAIELSSEPVMTLVASPDSELLPAEGWPYRLRAIRIVGVWGHSEELSLLVGQTVRDDPLSSSATTLTMLANHGVEPGETLKIESEQVSVTALGAGSTTTLTIVRGVNGTTAAAHVQGVAVYRRVYPADVAGAVITRCRTKWHAEYGGGSPGNDTLWEGRGSYTMYPAWKDVVRDYSGGTRRMPVGIA